jgi:hypothetical protein
MTLYYLPYHCLYVLFKSHIRHNTHGTVGLNGPDDIIYTNLIPVHNDCPGTLFCHPQTARPADPAAPPGYNDHLAVKSFAVVLLNVNHLFTFTPSFANAL